MSRNIVLYGLSFLVAGLTPLILLPFLTEYLTAAEFGAATLVIMTTIFFSGIVGISAHGYLAVEYYKSSYNVYLNKIKTMRVNLR